jgi:hypothetical protein
MPDDHQNNASMVLPAILLQIRYVRGGGFLAINDNKDEPKQR